MTTGIMITAFGVAGVILTVVLQAVLIPVFYKQQKKLLSDLENDS